jgi:hypothetical protein
VCRAPDNCLVERAGWCRHGLASWDLILAEGDGEGASGEGEGADRDGHVRGS